MGHTMIESSQPDYVRIQIHIFSSNTTSEVKNQTPSFNHALNLCLYYQQKTSRCLTTDEVARYSMLSSHFYSFIHKLPLSSS